MGEKGGRVWKERGDGGRREREGVRGKRGGGRLNTH